MKQRKSEPVDIEDLGSKQMPIKDVTPQEWERLTGSRGSVYIGPPAKQPDDLLSKLLSVKWPMAPDPQEPDDDDDRRTD